MPQHDNKLVEAVASIQEPEIKRLVREKLDAGVPPGDVLADCNQGMIELGNRFARGECFLPELMYGGMVMKNVMADLGPLLEQGPAARSAGKVVMGTVQHDVHDIGKDIVVMLLRGSGLEVIDLGVDVSPEKFVEAVRQHRPKVLGLSVLLTTCFKSVTNTVEALRQAGLREELSIMLGGAAASEMLREHSGCDFYGKTAVDGVHFASRLAATA